MVVGINCFVNTLARRFAGAPARDSVRRTMASCSFELDTGVQYDLAPFDDFAVDPRGEFRRAARDDFQTLTREEFAHPGRRDAAPGFFINFFNDVRRRARGREQPE